MFVYVYLQVKPGAYNPKRATAINSWTVFLRLSLFLDKLFQRKMTVADDVRTNQGENKKGRLSLVHRECVAFLYVIPFFFGQIPVLFKLVFPQHLSFFKHFPRAKLRHTFADIFRRIGVYWGRHEAIGTPFLIGSSLYFRCSDWTSFHFFFGKERNGGRVRGM